MGYNQPKKMLVLNILKILQKYSDEEHPLTQKEIMKYLTNEYGMEVERKAVKRNIDLLCDEDDYEIQFNDDVVRGKGRKKTAMHTKFYIIRDFDDSELRLLIDGLLFSKYIPYNQCKALIKKLENLSNVHFKSRVKYIQLLKDDPHSNKELFYTIDIIDEAIRKNKKVCYNYCNYNIEKKLEIKQENGKNRLYIVNPYQMVAANGRYYLLGVYEGHEELAHIRVDRIKNIKIYDEKIERNSDIIKNINLPKHMMEHIYMYSGDSVNVKFLFKKNRLNDVIDWFGKDINITKSKNDDMYIGQASVNQEAMRFWAMQYGDSVQVLEPVELVNEIKKELKDMCKKYKV